MRSLIKRAQRGASRATRRNARVREREGGGEFVVRLPITDDSLVHSAGFYLRAACVACVYESAISDRFASADVTPGDEPFKEV